MWQLCGLDGYADDLCDLARIERLDLSQRVYVKHSDDDREFGRDAPFTFGVADVVLFNPTTMAYDGARLT